MPIDPEEELDELELEAVAMDELMPTTSPAALNDKVKLTVVRDGKAIEVDMTLDQQEDRKTSASNDSGSNGNNNNQNGNGDNNQNGDGSDGFSDPFGLW